MTLIQRVVTITLSATVAGILIVPAAIACGPQPNQPFTTQQLRADSQNPLELLTSASLAQDLSNESEREKRFDRGNVGFSVYFPGQHDSQSLDP